MGPCRLFDILLGSDIQVGVLQLLNVVVGGAPYRHTSLIKAYDEPSRLRPNHIFVEAYVYQLKLEELFAKK